MLNNLNMFIYKNKMIISIGVDCCVASFLKKYNLRNYSFPFDWNVTYNGISQCIQNNFNDFIPDINSKINKYDISFVHDFTLNTFNDDICKYLRRIDRLKKILSECNDDIIFIRKGHSCHHHLEHNGKYENIVSDIDDIEKLDIFLKNKYNKLNYKIILLIICKKCFNSDVIYTSTSDRISIYNIVMSPVNDTVVETCLINALNIS
jgi:hypothetical protein